MSLAERPGAEAQEKANAATERNVEEGKGMSEEVEAAVRNLVSFRGSREAVDAVRQLDPESQALAAESYFNQMTGDREMPMAGSNREQYEVYLALKGSAFSNKFRELEDARLKKYEYGGFDL